MVNRQTKNYLQGIDNKHYLKNQSSLIVVILKSLMHKGCVACGAPIKSLEESEKHWEEKLRLKMEVKK